MIHTRHYIIALVPLLLAVTLLTHYQPPALLAATEGDQCGLSAGTTDPEFCLPYGCNKTDFRCRRCGWGYNKSYTYCPSGYNCNFTSGLCEEYVSPVSSTSSAASSLDGAKCRPQYPTDPNCSDAAFVKAEEEYQAAQDHWQAAQDHWQEAQDARSEAKEAYAETKISYKEALSECKDGYAQALEGCKAEETKAERKTCADAAKAERMTCITEAKADATVAKAEYAVAQTTYKTAKSAYATAKITWRSAERTFEKTKKLFGK